MLGRKRKSRRGLLTWAAELLGLSLDELGTELGLSTSNMYYFDARIGDLRFKVATDLRAMLIKRRKVTAEQWQRRVDRELKLCE